MSQSWEAADMDIRQRHDDHEELLRLAGQRLQSSIWTAVPCIVDAVDADKMTVDVQPVWSLQYRDQNGDAQAQQMPKLMACPLLFQGGGGFLLTFPVKVGDEALVIIASRSVDEWFQNGQAQSGPQARASVRMHSLSDGFALVGVRSVPNMVKLDTSNASLASDDGDVSLKIGVQDKNITVKAKGDITINTDGKFDVTAKSVTITASDGVTINGVKIDSSGNLTSPATITGQGDVKTGSGISLGTHTHTSTSPGSPTSPPLP